MVRDMYLVLGYFGYRTNKLDGQTVKTRNVYKLLGECVGDKVEFYDTEEFKYDRLSVLSMIWKVIRCKNLCYLPAHGNLRTIFPLIYCLSVIFRVKIHYFVVGGWLKEFLKNRPVIRWMLADISGIHVETYKLKQKLEDTYHFENVDIFPNFRNFSYDIKKFESEQRFRVSEKGCMRIAFISRVEQSKGLDTIVRIAKTLSLKGFSDRISFDFYGQKRDGYYDAYLLGNEFFDYKGVLQPEAVLGTLQKYDALIFPTHYKGEGCPGILVEALSAGLPIIASDWKYNDEFVENGVNGFLCETLNEEAYAEAIVTLAEDLEKRMSMARQSYIKSSFFSIDKAKALLTGILDS